MKRLQLLLALAAALAVLVLLVPALPLPDPVAMDVPHRFAASSAAHWLGQDEYGRDVFSRLLWGARVSLFVAVSASLLACVAGVALGIAGGYLGGVAELLCIRSMDVLQCFPPLLLALLVVTLMGPGAGTLIPTLAVVYLPSFVRVTYAGVLQVRKQEYVDAMRLLGAGPMRVMLRTILPNILGPVIVQASIATATAIMLESGLSFLGLGVVPPTPSWGLMIGAARTTMAQTPMLLIWPCLALSLTVLLLNALCDGLRDALDPRRITLARPSFLREVALGRSLAAGAPADAAEGKLSITGLTIEITTPAGPIRPVRDVTLSVKQGETLAIVGESGSGKSLTGLAVMGLLPPAAHVAAGSVRFEGAEILGLPDAAMRRLRGKSVAMVFQDPLSSLDPVHRIGDQITEVIRAHQRIGAGQAWQGAVRMLARVGIPDAARRARNFPHEMSGGMRQRAMIAMAIANRPRLLIADEPTTALDVTIQAQVLDLLDEIRREDGMGVVFVTHSLPVVAEIADRVAVMYAGEIVELGDTVSLFERPLHPYTAALLTSAPPEDGSLPQGIPGMVPSPHALPHGCLFAARCAHREAACETEEMVLRPMGQGRFTRCRRAESFASDPVAVQKVEMPA
jgi:peptide/nickel transport system permease protein